MSDYDHDLTHEDFANAMRREEQLEARLREVEAERNTLAGARSYWKERAEKVEAERAKLAEDYNWLLGSQSHWRELANRFEARVAELEAKNARLRELFLDIHPFQAEAKAQLETERL